MGVAAEGGGEVGEQILRLDAETAEHLGGGARALTDYAHEYMLRADIGVTHSSALQYRRVDDILGSGREIIGRKHRR